MQIRACVTSNPICIFAVKVRHTNENVYKYNQFVFSLIYMIPNLVRKYSFFFDRSRWYFLFFCKGFTSYSVVIYLFK